MSVSNQEILKLVRNRMSTEGASVDMERSYDPSNYPVADRENVEARMEDLHFSVPELYVLLLTEVGNGGFGPGYGLFGIEGGHLADSGKGFDEFYLANLKKFPVDPFDFTWPRRLVPVCDWGSTVYSCIDCRTSEGKIITFSEHGFTDTSQTFGEWMHDWAVGVKHWERMFEFGQKEIIDPFTKKATTITVKEAPIGVEFVAQRSSWN